MHNRKAKRNIPELNVELNSLLKQRGYHKKWEYDEDAKNPRNPKKYVPYAIMELAKVTIFVNPKPQYLCSQKDKIQL